MLRIMADMHQKDSCLRRARSWIIWQMTLLCFRLQRNAWSPVVHAMRQFWAGSRPALRILRCAWSTAATCGASGYGVFQILRELVDYGSSGQFSACSFSAFAWFNSGYKFMRQSTWLVFLVTTHLALYSFVVLRSLMLDIMASMDKKDSLRQVPQSRSCSFHGR